MRRNTSIYMKTPRGFSDESRDCGVRALAVVANIGYRTAHAALERHGRQRKRRTPWSVLQSAAYTFGFIRIDSARIDSTIQQPTLTQFIKEHKTGTFMLSSHSHCFALINGVVHDWKHGAGARARIVRVYQHMREAV